MPNYLKVQFIPWGLYTGPVFDDAQNEATCYPGVALVPGNRHLDALSQFLDIKARIAFTKLAIETAYREADLNTDTLKIFMAPDFLYRGAAGAYALDLLNGWTEDTAAPAMIPPPYDKEWPGLFGELRELVNNTKFQDWIFIFGSAVGANLTSSNGKIVTGPDGSGNPPASGWSLSLIQCGGDTEERRGACYVIKKHLKSAADFIQFNLLHPGAYVFAREDIDRTAAKDKAVLDRLMLENPSPRKAGGPTFSFSHICNIEGRILQFGLETCLDHAQQESPDAPQTGVTGRLAISGEAVNIQLVSSCGTALRESSLALAPKDGPKTYSYAFHCDGLVSHDPGGLRERELGGHVQLWGGSTDGASEQPSRHLVEIENSLQDQMAFPIDGSVDLSELQIPQDVQTALKIDPTHISAAQLWCSHAPFPDGGDPHGRFWPRGAGCVRILPAQPLYPPLDQTEDSPEA